MLIKIILILVLVTSFLMPVGDSASLVAKAGANNTLSSTSKGVDDPFQIHLKSRKFKPLSNSKGVRQAFFMQTNTVGPRAHILIQFKQLPDKKERDDLEGFSLKLLSYIPNNAWLASINKNRISQVAALPNVRWVGMPEPEDKISPSILKQGVAKWSRNTDNTVNITVLIFRDVDPLYSRQILEGYGNITKEFVKENRWFLMLPENSITPLAREDIVQWIENPPPPRTPLNNGLRAAIEADEVQAPPYGLNGTGVVVGEWDGGWVEANHSDLLGRVVIGDTGGSITGHATHVAGTLLGNGNLSSGTYRGVAPNASLVSYLWPYTLGELDSETNDSIVNYSAIISQNSWGWSVSALNSNCGLHGDYDSWSQRYDDIVRGRLGKRITIVFSAGNEEDDGDCPPYPWNQTTGPGGTAKNTISVGATYSDTNGHAIFSSRGPTDDGRIKPDLMAPGDEVGGDGGIKSTYPTNTYAVLAGTSMSAPAVSGTAALLYQDYRATHGDTDPLPSTIKALLIHTAVDLNNTGPDYTSGWGLINITAAIDIVRADLSSNNVIIEGNITAQGGYDEYSVMVSNGSADLKITLAWDDYPGTPNAAKTLMNDLDLVVIAPNGTRYYPWVLDPGNPSAGAITGIDRTNNVEQVYINAPLEGNWNIRVNGTTVPYLNQSYSLILGVPQDTTPPSITIVSPANTTYTSQIIPLNVSADENVSTWWYSLNSGPNTTFIPNTTIIADMGVNHLTVYANDSAGNMNSSTVYFIFSLVKNNNTGVFFTTLQQAINNATAGDTIIVFPGNLTENVDVNKSLSIVGNHSSAVTIQALNFSRHVFNVTASNVNISGLTVSGANGTGAAGIYINGAGNTNIYNNNITANYYGVFLNYSSNNTLSKNAVNSNANDGIYLYSFSNNNNLSNNNITTNNGSGIHLNFAGNTTMRGNSMTNNTYNFRISASLLPYLIQDIDTSNTVDGKPIYYWVNNQDQQIPLGAGYVGIVNSTNITVKNLTLTKNYQGVFLAYTNNSKIENVNVTNNSYGVFLRSSFNNTLINNTASLNDVGIYAASSNNNTLSNNMMKSNGWDFVSKGSFSNLLSMNFFNDVEASFTYSGDINMASPSSSINDPGGLYNIGKYLNITNATEAWVYVNISYVDYDVLTLEESTLKFYRYNGSAWMNVTGVNGVNEIYNYVYANITNFGVFAPLAKKDTTPPKITIHSPLNVSLTDQTPLLNATFSEIVNYTWYSVNGTTNSTPIGGVSNLTLNVSALSEGYHSITVYANDSAGNLNTSTVYFSVDVTTPAVNITSPANKTYYNSSVTFSLSVNDNLGVNTILYSVDGNTNNTYNATRTIAGLANGSHSIVVFTNDSAGNLNVTSVFFSLNYVNESVTDQAVNASGNWSNVSTSLVFLNISTSVALMGKVNVSAYAALPPGVNESLAVQRYIEINVSSNINASSGNLSWVYLRVNYTDSDVSGLDESTLRLYWWNPGAKNWTRLVTGINLTALDGPYVYGAGVNTASNYVWANISHLSIYGISGSPPTTTTTTATTGGGGGGGGGGGVSVNVSDLAYFRDVFKQNSLILVPSANVSEDWEAAMLIKNWFNSRGYSIDVKLVKEYDEIRDVYKKKIFIGGPVANPYSKDIGIDAFFTREAVNKPWLVKGEPGRGVVKIFVTDPLAYLKRGNVLVIAGADREQTLRVTREFLQEIEKQESLTTKTNLGAQLIL
jgi:parallel beta-helix repeat protein